METGIAPETLAAELEKRGILGNAPAGTRGIWCRAVRDLLAQAHCLWVALGIGVGVRCCSRPLS